MVDTTRTGDTRGKAAASMAGMEFYEIESFQVLSFCPDSNDASTPATQVHCVVRIKSSLSEGGRTVISVPKPPPLVMRYHGPDSLDAHIEAMIEHRTYVFGRREWRNDFDEQESK